MKMTFSILFIVSAMLIFMYGVYIHELVHQAILEDYGIESNITWSFSGAYVEWNSSKCNEMCLMQHNMNEVVGYNLQMFYLLITVGFLILILFKENEER